MSSKTDRKSDRCGLCGSALRDTTIVHEEKRGSKIYVFENVPVQVCGSCRELWIEEKTLREIERQPEKMRDACVWVKADLSED